MLLSLGIVTPSFNRKTYLAEAMASILDQRHPGVRYGIVDGGSTDGSVDIIRARSDELAWWCSEPDDGPWSAVNKGFAQIAGDVMGWLGSDDKLTPWSLAVVGDIFETLPEVEWLTTAHPLFWDHQGRAVKCDAQFSYSKRAFLMGDNLPMGAWEATGFIQQESTFWRRSLWERAGGKLNESLRLAADFDLWARFHSTGAELYAVMVPLGGFRIHGQQKSQTDRAIYLEEARGILDHHGGAIPGRVQSSLRHLRHRWPHRLAGIGERLGVVFPQKVIDYVHRDSRWVISTRFA